MTQLPRYLISLSLLALVGLSTFFGLDYRGNYPNISYAHFAAYFENPLKGYLAFRKNVLTSYLFDWKEGIRPVRSGSSVGFDLLDPSHPSAVAFRKQNKLDALVASTTSNFNKAIRIRQWTHEKVWPLTLSKIPYSLTREGKGGFTLLRGIQRNERMMCGEAATLFVQAAGVVGIPAREVIGYRHITAEAWSSDHRKWVLMDPLYNAHYERGGIPLSFLELTQAFYSKTGRKPEAYHHELDQVIHQSTGTSEDVFRKALGTIENFYRRVGIEPKGGPRSLPARIPSDRIKDVISGGAIGDMSHSAFAAFGVALRSDYLVYQYPIWHLRHYNHMWNYLYWTGSSPKRPNQAYQFTAKREDFNFTPRLPRQENQGGGHVILRILPPLLLAGRAAAAFTRSAIAAARTVVIRDPSWGKWGGRVIADLLLDGRSLSAALIAAGPHVIPGPWTLARLTVQPCGPTIVSVRETED